MSWKKFGGINQYEKHKSMHVKNIVAEQITFQDTYVGDFQIQEIETSGASLRTGGDQRVGNVALTSRVSPFVWKR